MPPSYLPLFVWGKRVCSTDFRSYRSVGNLYCLSCVEASLICFLICLLWFCNQEPVYLHLELKQQKAVLIDSDIYFNAGLSVHAPFGCRILKLAESQFVCRWTSIAVLHSAFLMLGVFHAFWRLCSWTLGYSSPFRKRAPVPCLALPCFSWCQGGGSGRSAVSWQECGAQIGDDLWWNQIIAMEPIQSYKGTLRPLGPGSSKLL